MIFKVTASRTFFRDPPRNPFLVDIANFGPATTTCRVWEIEAKDEAEVQRYWEDAQKQYLDNVVGFTLGNIEPLPGVAPSSQQS
jgi:hypothetical protein